MNAMTFAGTQEYFSAAELADIAQDRGITTFPTTKRGANLWMRAKGWDASHLCRKRAGRGGGLEYHFTLFPDCLRNAIDARDMRKSVMSRMQSEALADQRKLMAIRASALPAEARNVMDDGPDALDMLWQNTLLYAGGGGAGGAGNMQTASAPGAGQRSGFRLGGRG